MLDITDGLLLGLTAGLALGLANGLPLGLAEGSVLVIADGLVLGLTAGLALGIADGLLLGSALGIAGRVKVVQWVPLVQLEEALGTWIRKWLKAAVLLYVCNHCDNHDAAEIFFRARMMHAVAKAASVEEAVGITTWKGNNMMVRETCSERVSMIQVLKQW